MIPLQWVTATWFMWVCMFMGAPIHVVLIMGAVAYLLSPRYKTTETENITMSTEKLYADRDICELDEKGGFYFKHVLAMTAEGLHSKSNIAAELAHRDIRIKQLEDLLNDTRDYLTKHAVGMYGTALANMIDEVLPADKGEHNDDT